MGIDRFVGFRVGQIGLLHSSSTRRRFAGFYGSDWFAGFHVGQIDLLHYSSIRRWFAGFYGSDRFVASCGLWVVAYDVLVVACDGCCG